MILFTCLIAAALAAPFEHGASVATTWSAGRSHQALSVGVELPVLTSPHKQGRIPGPPAWQLYVIPSLTGGYHPAERVQGGASLGTGVRYVAPFGWKGQLVTSAGVSRARRIDGTEPKASTAFVPRAALHIGRDDWLPYHSRFSWHVGPALQARFVDGRATEWVGGVDLGWSWRMKAPR